GALRNVDRHDRAALRQVHPVRPRRIRPAGGTTAAPSRGQGCCCRAPGGSGPMNKIRERKRLLKAYRKTGDEDYRRAAEALNIPLLDHVQQLELYPGRRRGPTVGKKAGPRLYRMHRMVISGVGVLEAAKR